MENIFAPPQETSLQAKEKAQWIAFAPMVFQASRALSRTGVLACLDAHEPNGLTLEEVAAHSHLSLYAARVLLEAGLGIGLVTLDAQRYRLTKTGYFVLSDEMTRVNMDFVHDVCYQGLFSLEESLHNGRPEGLKTLGTWPTVYEGLSALPPHVQKSWFAFDHFYSDNAFQEALKIVFATPVKKLLDIGGNTGRFARACLAYNPDVHVTLMDLPGQIALAQKNFAATLPDNSSASNRTHFVGVDVLDAGQSFPVGHDVIWMSQFLDCFSEEMIVSILRRCRDALAANGTLYILEPFWDRQKFKAASFCLQQTSLYFTAIANGTSQMYSAELFRQCVERAGLSVAQEFNDLGIGHTLLKCVRC